jgi:hypothetical protein
MIYHLPDIKVPGGTLKVTFYNDYVEPKPGAPFEKTLSGDFLLEATEVRESVEESGFGGRLLLGDMEMKLFDRENVFSGGEGILNPTIVSSAQLSLILQDGATQYSLFYGNIDLSTVSYNLLYTDGSTLFQTCSFTARAIADELDTVTIATLNDRLQSVLRNGNASYAGNTGSGTFVKLLDVFDKIGRLIEEKANITVNYPTHNVTETFYTYYGAPYFPDRPYPFERLYLPYNLDNMIIITGFGSTLFHFNPATNSGNQGSFFNIPNVKELLGKLCSSFLVYPILSYNPSTSNFDFQLKPRASATPLNLNSLIDSERTIFQGYDAFRVTEEKPFAYSVIISAPEPGVIGELGRKLNFSMSNEQFELLKQKFDLKTPFALMSAMEKPKGARWNNLFVFSTVDTSVAAPVEKIIDTHFPEFVLDPAKPANEIDRFDYFLWRHFVGYWANWASPGGIDMYERKHAGLLLNPKVNVLDTIAIGGINYTVTEIQRDVLANETKIKAVKYS